MMMPALHTSAAHVYTDPLSRSGDMYLPPLLSDYLLVPIPMSRSGDMYLSL